MDLDARPGRDVELTKAKIRLMVSHARSLYRERIRTHADQLLIDCRTFVKKYLVKRDSPCYGTLGEISYTLARVYRQRQRFREALHEFIEAIRLYEKRAATKKNLGLPKAAEAALFSEHKVATILALGVAWCNATQGAMNAALFTNLIPARMILRRSGDVLNRAYADVIYASITRGRSSSSSEELTSAQEMVERAKRVFSRYGHKHYEAGAELELALTALAKKNIRDAKNHLRKLNELGEKEDFRWKRSAMIIESRILRHMSNNSKAFAIAIKAFDLAKKQEELLGQIDGLLASSEACGASRRAEAIKNLEHALRLNAGVGTAWTFNPKVHAICHLLLVEHYLATHRMYDALASFAEWERVRDQVEHVSIHELANKIAPRLDRTKTLVLDARTDSLGYEANGKRLREFLLRQAHIHTKTQGGVAALLGVSRTTINKWEREFRQK